MAKKKSKAKKRTLGKTKRTVAKKKAVKAPKAAKVAKAAGIERESLYRALSPRGNPRLSTLVAVTKAIGLKLTVEAIQPAKS